MDDTERFVYAVSLPETLSVCGAVGPRNAFKYGRVNTGTQIQWE